MPKALEPAGSPSLSDLMQRPSFVDEIAFDHEPREEVGRFLLAAEQALQQRGLHTVLITPAELLDLNRLQLPSWAELMPMLDHRYHAIDPTDMITVAPVDGAGRIVATISVRRLDIAASVQEELESLRMFYGKQAADKRARDKFVLRAPSGPHLKGNLYYMGGLWVHPEWRHAAMPWTLLRIVRYAALVAWDPEYEIALGTYSFLRPEVGGTYAYDHMEDGFEIHIDGKLRWEGVFLWLDRRGLRMNLAADTARLATAHADRRDAIKSRLSPERLYGSNTRR